jgi:hypothetical protein
VFIHRSLFKEVLTEDQASLVAKMCNQFIDQSAKVLYGNLYQDGSAKNFSTKREPNDTHVCLAIGIEEMGRLQPSESPIALDKPTNQDLVRAQADTIKQLQREISTLRGAK